MLQDLHSHSYYSYCGKDNPEDIIKNAIKNGLDIVGITDHYCGVVINRAGFSYDEDRNKVWIHSNALRRYYDHIKILSQKYRDKIDVWCGIEIKVNDLGYTLLPDGVDVSYFDYCLIENFQLETSVADDPISFAKRCGCSKVGLAHADLFAYMDKKGYNHDEFLKNMADANVFWELNVNYDSIHGYRILEYVNEFLNSAERIKKIKKSGVKLGVGFDSHRLEDYDINRVSEVCKRLEKLGVPMVK